jgi:iron complex transport system substrate-binding protein
MRSLRWVAVCLTIGMLWSLPAKVSPAEITFTDQRGKLVRLTGPASRAVVFPKPVASLFIAVDGGIEHLAGIHPAAQSVIMNSVLGRFYPGIANIDTKIVNEGFIPNVEELLSINPDVVFQWALKTEQYIEPMERVGLTVVGFSYGTYKLEKERISIVGKVVEKEARAASFLAWQDQVYHDLDDVLDKIPQERRARMIFVDRFQGNELALFGRNEFFFQMPGLRNLVFEAGMNEPRVTVSAEQVLSWDPEIIFLNYYDAESAPKNFYDNPVYDSLSAVKNRRIYKTPSLDPAAHEGPLVWMWMTMLAYPELRGWDLRQILKEKYAEMYGHSPSDDDVDKIMQLATNADSKYYVEKFAK